MKQRLFTSLFSLDVGNFEWNIAHLYEHILIASFEQRLVEHGYSRATYGWCNAETFPEVMFIEAGFYDEISQKVFTDFISSSQRIDEKLVQNELLKIQAEESAVIDDVNLDTVISELRKLDQQSFKDMDQPHLPVSYECKNDDVNSILKLRSASSDFEVRQVWIGFENYSLHEAVVFMRLLPLLLQSVDRELSDMGIYANTGNAMPYRDEKSGVLQGVAAYSMHKNSKTDDEITKAVRSALAHVGDAGQEASLLRYIRAFSDVDSWHTFPMDYYRNTGIVATRQGITQKFTMETIHYIVGRLEVEIKRVEVGDD